MSQVNTPPIIQPTPPAPPSLTIEGLVAGFAAAGVSDANAAQIIPLSVTVAQAVNAAGITPQQFATFATKAIQTALAQATAQKASLLKAQADTAAKLAALGV